MLSPLDDYPVHQVPEPIRNVGTSDRNFYDRYYFNMHHCSDEIFLVAGMGQYPNLGVQDAFVAVLRNGMHRVVRASRELGDDRMRTDVGPIRVEVIEGLRKLRLVCEPNDWDIEVDATYEGGIPAHQEPRHYRRQLERVTFDSMRLAQTGHWSGRVRVGDETFDVTPDEWWGARDRSWGIRPVGEAEPPGMSAARPPGNFFWNYSPMQFRDFSILYIVQEEADGTRILEEAVRVHPFGSGREPELLGHPEHELVFIPGTRDISSATIRFTEPDGSDLDVYVTTLLPMYLGIGTGYGMEQDWRHGMYQGALKVEGRTYDTEKDKMWGIVDAVARFEAAGEVGYGLWEYAVFGPHAKYGFEGWENMGI